MLLSRRGVRPAAFLILSVLFLSMILSGGAAWAFIREGAIPGRPGLSFHHMTFRFDALSVSITNGTGQNVIFGGTMVFLDRHRRTVARAELLPEKIKRRSTRQYRGVFVEGSGETAASASWLVWELSQRNN